MGIRRLGKRRLAAIEKRGILKDVGASSVMSNAIISATQHRQGQMVTTDIVLDLGSSTAGLKTQATAAALPIGTTTTAASYVCRVTNPVFGIVTAVDVICLEAISDGTLTDFDVMYATGDNGDLNTAATTGVSIKAGVGAKGYHETAAYDLQELKNKYIYVTSGAATGQKATTTIDCGDAVIANIVSGITRIRLAKTDGTTIDVVADSGKAKAATDAGKFGTSDVSTTADLALSLKNGIGATNGGSGVFATSNPTSTTVLVTQHSTTVTNNGTNYLVDDPEKASGIELPSFTGGIDDGQAMASGKLLLRFTGFMAFDDI